MRAFVIFDDDDYIISFKTSSDGPYDLPEIDLNYINCYYYSDGEFLLDENKKASIEEEDSKHDEIEELKKKLKDSDYIISEWGEEIVSLSNPLTWVADVIKINLKYLAKYSDLLKSRSEWRERIHELEG